ncbi:AraC family transcriptional regulator [Paludibacterium yongneupense]|uniref:AraC family transcriptional regulator n=1 Tax=Paludibacterium yongneupense TaxID=400061 RepID=UPI000401F6B6|nr:AraC family transcriptional regulator [Paludibacterium yongneupense]
MDPLSNALALLKPRHYLAGGMDLGANVSLHFGRHEGIKCYSVVYGDCWISLDDDSPAVHLMAGDSFLLLHGRAFCLSTDLDTPPVDAIPFLSTIRRENGVARIGGGGRCSIVGGFFTFEGSDARSLFTQFPPIVALQSDADKNAMRASIESMREELKAQQPGVDLVVQNLAYLMLIQALRRHLSDQRPPCAGWLFALSDPVMKHAISAMHQLPDQAWTVEKLARHVGMSRSVFAQRFKERVGTSPIEYLTEWRMRLAEDRLKNTHDSLGEIALSLGYESESAFSTAFKRVMGSSPRKHGRKRAEPS